MADCDERLCPDCDSKLQPIRLIDATHPGGGEGAQHISLQYAPWDGKQGWFFKRYPVEGTVMGWMCGECGRVLLYAQPKP